MVQIKTLSTPECHEGVPSPGRQHEGEHGVVHHVQGEHYHRSIARNQIGLQAAF